MFYCTMKGDGQCPLGVNIPIVGNRNGWWDDHTTFTMSCPCTMLRPWHIQDKASPILPRIKNQDKPDIATQSDWLHFPFCAKLCNSLHWMTQRLRCLKQTGPMQAFHSCRYRHLRKIKVIHVNVIQNESWLVSWCLSNEFSLFFSQWGRIEFILIYPSFLSGADRSKLTNSLVSLWHQAQQVALVFEGDFDRGKIWGIGPVDLGIS